MAQLASTQYLSVHSLPQEDRYDTDDRVATQRAETHHRQSVHDAEVEGVQLDEAHSKLRPRQVEWVHTALAMGSWLLLWVDFGPRTQERGDNPHRPSRGPRAVAAGSCSRMGGRPTRRRSCKSVVSAIGLGGGARWAASPNRGWRSPKALFYAQVVKVRNKTGQVVEVSRRVV